MHLSRGNHESHSMNKMYGFDGEVRGRGRHRKLGVWCVLGGARPRTFWAAPRAGLIGFEANRGSGVRQGPQTGRGRLDF